MLNRGTQSILKRELKSKIATKSFIIGTLALPLLMIAVMGFQYLTMSYDGDQGTRLTFVTDNFETATALEQEFAEKDFVTDGSFIIDYKTFAPENYEKEFESVKEEILNESIAAAVVISDSSFVGKNVTVYSASAKNISLERRIGWGINNVMTSKYFKEKNLSPEDISYARQGIDFKSLKIKSGEDVEEESGGQLILAYLFAFLLYISLLMMGSYMLQGVIEEKQNRVVEVILSSVSARQLMTGKVLGSALTGLLQMVIWMSPILAIIMFSLPVLPPEIVLSLDWMQILYYFINFFIGLIIFLGLFGTVGSIYDNPQDAQQSMMPLMMLIILPFILTFSMLKNPANPIALIASFLPFTNIIVMPVRMTLTEVPVWHTLAALVVNIATLVGIFPVAGKIYQVGILSTGKKPKLKEVIAWLKINY